MSDIFQGTRLADSMTQLEEVRRRIEELSNEDQRRLAESLALNLNLWPGGTVMRGIDSHPDICGGEPRIVRTRIPVWTLEQMRRQGLSEAQILASYPTLRAEDLVNAWNYADLHRDEIDRQIIDNEEA